MSWPFDVLGVYFAASCPISALFLAKVSPMNNKIGFIFAAALIAISSFVGEANAQARVRTNSSDAVEFRALFNARENVNVSQVTRAEAENGLDFTIDRTQLGSVLVKYDNSPEVWALQSTSGPRGDEFLRNDIGQVVLRITSLGGVTLFVNGDSVGQAASFAGRGDVIAPMNNRYNGTAQAAVEHWVRQFDTRILPNLRIETIGGVPPALLNETLEITYDAVDDIPDVVFTRNGRRFRLIRISRAPQAFAMMQAQVLEIGVTPGIGYAGRPSSAAIRKAVVGN